jgi:glycosyltransferase involved in cell wall biosynthesis
MHDEEKRADLMEEAKLRVTLVIGTLNRGGSEGQLVALARGLRARGHHVSVACLEEEGAMAEFVRQHGIEVREGGFQGLKLLKNPFLLMRTLLRLHRLIAKDRADIVQCYLYWSTLLGVPLARLARVPVVLASRRSQAHSRGAHLVLRPLEFIAERWADAVICNSQAVLEDAVGHGGAPARKVLVIPNGAHLPSPTPIPSEGPLRILVISNLIAYKGHRYLLCAFAKVVGELGPDRVKLDLAGRGPEEAALRAQASDLGIARDVRFLGSVDDVGALLHQASFTVLPSLTEGMPNAILESLAHGRPVIASRVGGVPEILEHGGGSMVPPGDIDALAAAILELADDPDRLAVLGAEGRQVVEKHYAMEDMVERTLGLYRMLLVKRAQRGRARGGRPQG